jgi:von willebrand factor-binding protein
MFRDNKREIFGFRKYKAYGLASAVIAAFFLMGGVASADEVTSTNEAPANNATVASGVSNVANGNATDTSVTSPYVSEQAKRAVQDNLAPLAKSTTPAPTASQIYKENPTDASKLTADDKVVEAESKEAFDKLPDSVRRRVKSVTIEKKENGNLGHTASISGNVTLNAQYFHNDGKDSETEVLYHEIGHAIDGATYKRNADGSDYSLSRDTAVQPLIQKAYPGQVNYEGWASMFGTYMLQKTGQREIKTDLDREINDYFTNLMVGFTESSTQLNGRFVVTGTNAQTKRLTKNDLTNGAYNLQGSYTFSASGPDTVSNAKLVYESPKQFLEQPTFTKSQLASNPVDKSDTTTWRYEFALSPIGGTTVGELSVTQKSKGLIWGGPSSKEPLLGTFKILQDGLVTDSSTISVTTDRVKGGLYRSDVTTVPTNVRKLPVDGNNVIPNEVTIGVHDGSKFLTDDSAASILRLPVPSVSFYFLKNLDDANVSRDYERYTDFKYSITGIPDYLELDPDVESNKLWTKEGDAIIMHRTPNNPFPASLYPSEMYPALRLKKDALSATDTRELIANQKSVYLTWRTDGTLRDGSIYTQTVPDPSGILLRTRNEHDPLPEGTVGYDYKRLNTAGPLLAKADRQHESYHLISQMTDRTLSGSQVSSTYYYVHIPKEQEGDRFTSFAPVADDFWANIDGQDQNASATGLSSGINLPSDFEVYGVESDGSTTKLGSWSTINKDTKGITINGNYQKLLVKIPTMKDVRSKIAHPEIFGWGANVTYEVGETRWQNAVQDPSVTKMTNGLRTDFVRGEQSLAFGASVEQKDLTQEQLKDTNRLYIHEKTTFEHKLKASIGVNSKQAKKTPNVGLGDHAYVGVYGDLSAYYQYLMSAENRESQLDNIQKAYIGVLVPDGVAIKNARTYLTDQLLSSQAVYYGALDYTRDTAPIQDPVSKIVNYNGTGKTLYTYQAPQNTKALANLDKLPKPIGTAADAPAVELTFEFTNSGALSPGTHEIEYTTIWDKNSEIIRPTKDQRLSSYGKTLSDVLPASLQDGMSDQTVSVIKIPFKVAYNKEYASRLYIGPDELTSTESSVDGVHLGATVNVQSRSMNFSDSDNTLTDIIVPVPSGKFRTTLVDKIPDGTNYRVVYTTDANVKTGTYGEAPSDLSQVTAVKYMFTTPLTLHTGDSFVTNMKVRVPQDAPALTPATSQLYTSSNRTDFLDGNIVTVTTTANKGSVVAHYVDTEGNTLKPDATQTGLNGTEYRTTKPDTIPANGTTYLFKEVKAGSDSEQGQYVVDQTKQITYVYEKDTRGSVVVRHQDASTQELLIPEQTVKDHVPSGEAYTTQPLTDTTSVRTNEQGLTETVTTRYTLVRTPDNANGTVLPNQTIAVIYEYNKQISTVTNGSVVATYKDEAGNELAPQVNVHMNVKPGTNYTTESKTFDAKIETVDGLTRTTTYTLIARPDNAEGVVKDGQVITVPYVYRKNVVTNGSVVATYKTTTGEILAPQESIATNETPGTAYTTSAKTFDTVVDQVNGFTRTTSYRLRETPNNATGNVQDGTTTVVPYVYLKTVVVNGSVIATHKDTEGNELVPKELVATNVPNGTAYSTLAKDIPDKVETSTTPDGFTRTITTKYTLLDIPMNDAGSVEGGTTIIVPYVYDKTETVTVNGSVIATYKDTEGNELAPQENVKTDVPDGEAYTTSAKTIKSSEVVEKTPEGLTKRTTTSYELTETPANANGNVVGNQTITVPYVYRKNVTVQIYGSVIATYKDEEGHELTSSEKVITNQPGGTYYEAAPKDIQGSAHATVTPEGRRVTITTYKLIKTPDNEHGDVVGGEIIEVPYVYRKNVEERMVPGDTPSVEIPATKVTQYQTEDGTDIKDSEQGFVDAPNTIDKYQFTGTTKTNEAGDVQTHIYKLIETEVPGDAPKVDIPALNGTRYVNEEGTEIKDAEEGLIPAPSMIGENYQFTGRTERTEDGTVQTHIYKLVEHEVPSDAPKREPEEIQITLHVDEETGKELVEYDPGLASPKKIEHYTYTGKTTQEEGIRIHYYKKVITEIPSDAPSVEIPELKATRYQTEDGTDVKDSETGFVDAPNMIGNYQFTGVTNTNDGGDVQTHIYKLIETEVPSNAPQVDIPELRLTRHVNEKGDELLPIEEGSNGPRKTIGDYEYTGRTDVEGGVTTHVYAPIRYEIPSDAPQYNIPELKVTRHVDEKDKELIETEKGIQPPRKTIDDHEYTGRTTEKDGITTHVYTPIKHEVPGDAPQYDIPELKVTRHVDGKGKELIETEKGIQPPRKTIGDHEYTGRTTEKDGITTHVYESIKHEVPGDAPIVDVPELKATRYVNEKGEEIKESEAGFVDAPKTIGDYEFTGKTKLNNGKDVQTHTYKLVEKPVMPTPDPKNPEPKKPETPQPEALKPIEIPKSNDSVVVESVDQPQFVKNELPKTGETNSNSLAFAGMSVLTALGLIGFIKRKREE